MTVLWHSHEAIMKAEVVTPDHTYSKTADTGEGTTLYKEERVYEYE